ncbi:hypothetical protein GHO44_26655, partial [Pseudomonas helleri]|nr:hypothetical protein [Pseudomonas helleri]
MYAWRQSARIAAPGAWSGGWRAVMGFDQIRQRRLSDDIVEQLEGM